VPIFSFLIEKLESFAVKHKGEVLEKVANAALEKINQYFDLADAFVYDIAIGN